MCFFCYSNLTYKAKKYTIFLYYRGDYMALQIANIGLMKKSSVDIENSKNTYDDTLKEIENAIKSTENSWNDQDGNDFREKVMLLLDNELKDISEEMEFEINYIKKVSTVLENAQEQVKNRINN